MTAENRLVSIITPAYNAARFIEQTIDSVRAQTYPHWEMWIADDGSKDDTVERVRRKCQEDPRVRLVTLPGNSGPAHARNAALERATGRFVAFLDSDDMWLPTKLERQLAHIERFQAPISFTAYRRVSQDGQTVGRLVEVPQSVTYSGLLKHNVIACLTAMVDTAKTGPIRMVAEGYDDFILWLAILRKVGGRAFGLNEDLARYRVVGGSVSHKPVRAAGWVWNIYRNVEKLSLPHALYVFGNYVVRVLLKKRRF